MESQNRLGIYLRKDRATVVCLAPQGRDRRLLGCFSISTDDRVEQSQQMLADRIARECAERGIKFGEAAVALDCALFMQHRVHSDFGDHKKIAATIRFDTEEALATDVSDMAVAFRIASNGDGGATLDVFTVQRSVLSDVLLSLQSNGIDPVTVDPDVCCLSRFLGEYGRTQESRTSGTLYALLSDSRGYLIGRASNSDNALTMRAFPIGAAQDRTALLTREALVTTALAETAGPMERMCVSDASGRLDTRNLGQKVGLLVDGCDVTGMIGVESSQVAECPDRVDFAIAYGAALTGPSKDASINFRNDHMPYLGKKMRVQKAVRFLSISVAILLLAVGIYFHSQLMRVNRQREALREKLEPDYLAVMLNKRKLPPKMADAAKDVEGELRRVKRGRAGEWTEASVPARLAQVLQALNSCARQTGLNIKSITISNNIIINGDTSNRPNLVTVFDAFEKAGLPVGPSGASDKDGRCTFTVTLEPRR